MAVLLLGAAGIHFAAMGEHAGVSWTHGLFFGLTAWAQVMLAALLVLGPARRSIQVMIVFNFAVILVWIVSRTVGIAIGTDGTPESIGFADALCAAFEALAIGLGLLVICGGIARKRIRLSAGWAIAGVIAIVVAALSSFGFSPAIADGSGGGHTHGATPAIAAPAAGSAAPAAHVHDHGSTTPTDLNGHPIEGVKAQDIAAENQPDVPLDAATRGHAAAAARGRARDGDALPDRRQRAWPPATTSSAGSVPAVAPTTSAASPGSSAGASIPAGHWR